MRDPLFEMDPFLRRYLQDPTNCERYFHYCKGRDYLNICLLFKVFSLVIAWCVLRGMLHNGIHTGLAADLMILALCTFTSFVCRHKFSAELKTLKNLGNQASSA